MPFIGTLGGTQTYRIVSSYARPNAPTVNTPTNTGTTLNMSWNRPSGIINFFTVYVLASGSLTATLTPGNVLSTTFSPMTPNVPYSFYVTATGPGGTSVNSTTSATVTLSAGPPAPASVTFNTIGLMFGTFDVAAVAGATQYTVNVFRAATRTNTGGTLVTSATSATTSVNRGFDYNQYFTEGFYYLTATCQDSSGVSSPDVTSTQICTMLGFTGANRTWVSPFSGTIRICLCGGGATAGVTSGGSGGLLVATVGVSNGTSYSVAVGGGGGGAYGDTAGGWGGINGASSGGNAGTGAGAEGYSGAGGSQFQTWMYAGGGGGGGNSTSLCTDGNGGAGGNGGGTTGAAGQNGLNNATFSRGGGGGTAAAGGAGGAGAGGGGAGQAGQTARGGNGGTGSFLRGNGGGGGWRGGGGGGGLNTFGPTGGGGGASSATNTVSLISNIQGGARNGEFDYRFYINGFPGSFAAIW